ncbi:MAG: hypothetical protein Q7S33_04970 [Nanoarchaeota archaeon]|nr:hypothetical protein [Nanoarchaeota archaeon]
MGRKKLIQKIPKAVIIKCPHCSEKTKIKISQEGVFSLDCKKCKQKISTPITQCCIICAFSDKKCPRSLMIEARAKGLEIK